MRLRDSLHEVRQRGYAMVESELEEGLLSAAVPVRDPDGTVVAALAYSTSVGRRTLAQVTGEVVPLMLEAADGISADLAEHRVAGTRSVPRDGFF